MFTFLLRSYFLYSMERAFDLV
uniref:Uncharacterized protein n=1 Tax=Rhizophora mucronata TaxID=61149 RepID=A0A2P2JBG2_RHIMU